MNENIWENEGAVTEAAQKDELILNQLKDRFNFNENQLKMLDWMTGLIDEKTRYWNEMKSVFDNAVELSKILVRSRCNTKSFTCWERNFFPRAKAIEERKKQASNVSAIASSVRGE